MYSLNEIESAVKRAARGVGLDWGLAEEAGKAARWLEARGRPGCAAMAAHFALLDGRDYRDFCPAQTQGIWAAKAGLCPIITGAALSDRAAIFAEGGSVNLARVHHPLILVPFAGMAGKHAGVAVVLDWHDAQFTLCAEGTLKAEIGALMGAQGKRVAVRCASQADLERDTQVGVRTPVAPDAWAALDAFGYRTFAPETESSRVSGAGADGSDND